MGRRSVPKPTIIQVLTESGYRCAVPTCRIILAIDIHHMEEVSEGGGDDPTNLLPLCPTCHALFHRGEISRDCIYAWKSMLVSLSSAFDVNTIDDLLFLSTPEAIKDLFISGDGVLKFSRLIAAGLANFKLNMRNGPLLIYKVSLTQKGELLIKAWKSGKRDEITKILSGEP